MKPILKNAIAIILGIIIGGVVNMAIIMLSGKVIPLPEGIDPADPESLKAGIHLFEAKHYIMPFLAHALGTLAGAFLTTKLAVSHHLKQALAIGAFFLIGGIMSVYQLGTPFWPSLIDLVFAYIPFAWFGWKLGTK